DVQRLVAPERVDPGGGQVRAQRHVRLVDGLETTDRGSVEGQLLVGVERLSRHREVLHHAREVAEADVDELDVLVRDELLGLVGVLEHPAPPTPDRKSTRLNSSHVKISYAVFCLQKKNHWK